MPSNLAVANILSSFADRLRSEPDFIMPDRIESFKTSKPMIVWYPESGSKETEIAVAVRRQLGGTWKKTVTDSFLYMDMEDDAVHYQILVWRTTVCTKRVTGKKTVTKTVPDPDALALVPQIEVTTEEEEFEWDCGSLLGDE